MQETAEEHNQNETAKKETKIQTFTWPLNMAK